MRQKLIKGSIWLPVFIVLCMGLLADIACANIGTNNLPPASENDLLQFRTKNHIIGFKSDKVYMINTSGFLSVEFLGAYDVVPIGTAADSNQVKDDPALSQNSNNTLANLQRVEYQTLWDGITLRYDAVKDGIAESTYFIQPKGNVADIKLRYNADTELQKDGSLKINLSTRQGYISESRPVAWQMLDGQKKEVQVAYEIKDGTIGFKTGAYNKDHELIIDPTYQWHTFYGSANYHEGSGIAVDVNGNVYVTGQSQGSWLGPNNTAPKHAYQGGRDIVILKLDRSGGYQWHTFYGSANNDDRGSGIAVDKNGNVYVTGTSQGSWLGPNNSAPEHAYKGGSDIVALKLNSSGTYQWHTFYGSSTGNDYGRAIAVDENGYSYITGESFASWGVIINAGVFLPKHSHSGFSDIVAVKLTSSGTYQWHTFYGSDGYDHGKSIAIDQNGNIFIIGESNTSWLGPNSDSPKYAHSGGWDIVGLKLKSSGGYNGHSFFGSAMDDYGQGVAIDKNGNIYITGYSLASWGSPVHPFSPSLSDIVVFRLDSSGTLIWNTFHGFVDDDYSYGIALDGTGNIYITGYGWDSTWGSDGDQIVTCKLSSSGKLLWYTFHGSAENDDGQAIALDGDGNIYVTGSSDAAWGSPQHAYSADSDIFVLKFHQFPWPMFLPAITNDAQK